MAPEASERLKTAPFEASYEAAEFLEKFQALSPKNESQRVLKDRAVRMAADIAKTRLLLFVGANSMPTPFLLVLAFWLPIIFASFSLFAQRNVVVVSSLFIFALSATGAIFLILEMSEPFTGLMRIPDEQLRYALAPLRS